MGAVDKFRECMRSTTTNGGKCKVMHKLAGQTNRRTWEVCAVVEHKMMHNDADKDVMDRTAKFANSVKVHKRHGTQKDYLVWTSPAVKIHPGDEDYLNRLPQMSYCLDNEIQLEWPTRNTPFGVTQPPEIRAILPILAMRLNSINPMQNMKTSDKEYLASTYVRDKRDGNIRLPNLQLIMQWLGWSSQAYGLVAVRNPCKDKATCGRINEGWCQTCGEVIAQFASGWHHRSMTAVLIDVLREHAVANRFGAQHVHWDWSTPPHTCDFISCQMNRTANS